MKSGTILIANNYFGKDITTVKKAEDANHANSSPLTISIPARPSKPSDIEVAKATDDNAANGKITGVDATMEYKAADDDEARQNQRQHAHKQRLYLIKLTIL